MGKNNALSQQSRTGVLIILDGFGLNPKKEFNAVAGAAMPVFRGLWEKYPHAELQASEGFVGLPQGFMGNSEVGHLNIGAGRVVYQDFSLISKAIEDGSFYSNPIFSELLVKMQTVKPAPALHLMGLVSDGGVHSHLSHLYALISWAKQNAIREVYIHAFTDGRDTSPTSARAFLSQLEEFCRDTGLGKIATISGRFYGMDRDQRWERTALAFRAIVSGEGTETYTDSKAYVESQYDKNNTDEFLSPASLKGYRGIKDGDGIIFFNFRADRARQITRALTENQFRAFPRERFPALSGFVCMTPYDASFGLPTAFGKPKVPNTLGEVVSRLGWEQLRIAETEKYAHVTYFFNGGVEEAFLGEKRILIPSPRDVRTYDLKPEMSAGQVAESLLKELNSGRYRFAVVNFANPDMVGHTGNYPAAVKAVEVIDACLSKIVAWVESTGNFALLTADHGNCEMMQDENGLPMTAHTLLPVPCILIDPSHRGAKLSESGKLCDIAPTLLQIWGVPKPDEMTGRSILTALD